MRYCFAVHRKTQIHRLLALFVACSIALVALFYWPVAYAQSQSVLFITETSCSQVGVWSDSTCTLTGDVAVPLVIQTAGMTLDGDGYTVTAAAGLNDATIAILGSGVTVKNTGISSTAENALFIADGSQGVLVENIRIINPVTGIRVQGDGVIVKDVSVVGDGSTVFGMRIDQAADVAVSSFSVIESRVGVSIFDSTDVHITESRIADVQTGIILQASSDVLLEQSILDQVSRIGIEIVGQTSVLITDNQITSTSAGVSGTAREGIRFGDTEGILETVIIGNDISLWDTAINDRTTYDVGGPIQVGLLTPFKTIWELMVPTVWAQATPQILIHRNNFFENNVGYDIPVDAAERITLHQGGIGNYWENYDESTEGCTDSDEDLVCDEPYQLPGAISDIAPAIEQFDTVMEPIVSASCSLYAANEVPADQDLVVRFTSVFADEFVTSDSNGEVYSETNTFQVTPTASGTQIISATVTGVGGSSDCSVDVLVVGEVLPPKPTGASSVLFLPGIQASRLYKDGSFGTEDQLWEPTLNFGQDVSQLAFDSNRESINAIYTKEEDIIDTANFVPGLSFDDFVVYETWIDRLNQEKENTTIADWYALAYDWRYDVFDVVRDGIQTGPASNRAVIRPLVALEKLADAAPNNKVSIVAHSNGGLLAKAMLIEADRLCRDNPGRPCLIDRVDQLILLGSPQIGTPESLKGLLHGDENNIKTYPAVPAADVRVVAQTLPGTHTLLPSEEYLSGLGFSTISFIGNGPDFERFRMAYPEGVRTSEQLQAFLRGAEGRNNPDFGDVYRPGILDEQLVETGAESIRLLSDWIVPESITVTEIVGVGAPTISRLRYDSFEETRRSLSGVKFIIDRTTVRFGTTLYGDQTVMARSAEAYEGEKETYYFDLQIYNEFAAEEGSGLLPANHANLTEPSDIQDLLISLVTSSSAPISHFISQTLPQYENERYDGLSTFSPVDLLIEDVDGNRTGLLRNEDGIGRIVEEIPNSRFFMIGSSSHLYVPSDTEYDVRISGYQEGSYSLVIEEIIEGQPPQEITRFENATVTPIMLVTLNKTDGLFSQITTDYNADGIIDEVRKSDGEVDVVVAEDSSQEVPLTNPEIEVEPPTVVERIAGSSSSATRINRSILVGQVAGITTSTMTEVEHLEELARLLTRLSELLTLLYKI
jgi:nitrous oxidase accessory protein NosD/pimeloyl-ACP methyl ester carboxylesterase